MVAAKVQARFTEVEYLALEAVAETRHEYCGGDIHGMAGAELRHNQVAQNVKTDLSVALSGRPCHVVGSDQRVKVEATSEYFYPDGVMTCLEPLLVEPPPRSLLNPQVLVEVLSPSTEARDRGAKWLAYQTIPTLTDFLLVSTDTRRVEHYRRNSDGTWTYTDARAGRVVLTNGVALDVADAYRMTDVP
ncbi:MAG: Uma2 family endonuclease [Myxococcota bacterium]